MQLHNNETAADPRERTDENKQYVASEESQQDSLPDNNQEDEQLETEELSEADFSDDDEE